MSPYRVLLVGRRYLDLQLMCGLTCRSVWPTAPRPRGTAASPGRVRHPAIASKATADPAQRWPSRAP